MPILDTFIAESLHKCGLGEPFLATDRNLANVNEALDFIELELVDKGINIKT